MSYRYEELTWPEMREAVAAHKVVVLPVGSTEDHGHHLPLLVDFCTVTEIAHRAVEKVPDKALLMPPVYYGFEEHHMEFPGTIAIEGHNLINYVTDIGASVARHGFTKMLLLNGHGSNMPFLEVAARNVTNSTPAICALASWWGLGRKIMEEVRESQFPLGVSHACEMETSALLYLRPELVQMDKAQKDFSAQTSEHIWWDLQRPAPVLFIEWWSRNSKEGVIGDPTLATREKGERLVEGIAEELARFLTEFRAREIRPRVDHH